jgi:hypothetical protein
MTATNQVVNGRKRPKQLADVPGLAEQQDAARKVIGAITDMRGLSRFHEWVANRAVPVQIVPSTAVVGIEQPLHEYLNRNRPRRGQCFFNAFYCAEAVPGVSIVHGYVTLKMSGLLFEHAWNEYAGQHFDVTTEAHGTGFHGHVQVVRVSSREYCDYLMEMMSHRFLLGPCFGREVPLDSR